MQSQVNAPLLKQKAIPAFHWKIENLSLNEIFKRLFLQAEIFRLQVKRPEPEQDAPVKSGFGLGFKKTTVVQKKTRTDVLTNTIELDGDVQDVKMKFAQLFGMQYKADQLFNRPVVFIDLGVLRFRKGLQKPQQLALVSIPVRLYPTGGDFPFEIRYEGLHTQYTNELHQFIAELETDEKKPDVSQEPSEKNLKQLFSFLNQHIPAAMNASIEEDVFISAYNTTLDIPAAESTEAILFEEAPKGSVLDYLNTGKSIYQFLDDKQAGLLSRLQESPVALLQHEKLVALQPYTRHIIADNLVAGGTSIVLAPDNKRLEEAIELLPVKLRSEVLLFHRSRNWPDALVLAQHSMAELPSFELEYIKRPSVKKLYDAIHRVSLHEAALNEPDAIIGYSPVELMDKIRSMSKEDVLSLPDLDMKSVTQEMMEEYREFLLRYMNVRKELENLNEPIWLEVNTGDWDEEIAQKVGALLEQASQTLDHALNIIYDTCEVCGLPSPEKNADLNQFSDEINFLKEVPEIDARQLDLKWSPIPKEIEKGLGLLHDGQILIGVLRTYFHPEILHEHLEDLVPQLQQKSTSPARFVDFNYKAHIKRIRQYLKNPNTDIDDKFWNHLNNAINVKKHLHELNAIESTMKSYFFDFWNGIDSDHEQLKKQLNWLGKFTLRRETIKTKGNINRTKQFLASKKKELKFNRNTIKSELYTLLDQIKSIADVLKAKEDPFLTNPTDFHLLDLQSEFKKRIEHLDEIRVWASSNKVTSHPLFQTLQPVMVRIQDWTAEGIEKALSGIENNMLQSKLDMILKDRPVISGSHSRDVLDNLESIYRDINAILVHDRQQLYYQLNVLKEARRKDKALYQKKVLFDASLKNLNMFRYSEQIKELVPYLQSEFPVVFARYDQLPQLLDAGFRFDFSLLIEPKPAQTLEVQTARTIIYTIRKRYDVPTSIKEQPNCVAFSIQSEDEVRPIRYASMEVANNLIAPGKLPYQVTDSVSKVYGESKPTETLGLVCEDENYENQFWLQLCTTISGDEGLKKLFINDRSCPFYIIDENEPEIKRIDYLIWDLTKEAPKVAGGFGLKKAAFSFGKKEAATSDPKAAKLKKLVQQAVHIIHREDIKDDVVRLKIKTMKGASKDTKKASTALTKALSEYYAPEVLTAHIGASEYEAVLSTPENEHFGYILSDKRVLDKPLHAHYYSLRSKYVNMFHQSYYKVFLQADSTISEIDKILFPDAETLNVKEPEVPTREEVHQGELAEKTAKLKSSMVFKASMYALENEDELMGNIIHVDPVDIPYLEQTKPTQSLLLELLPMVKPYVLFEGHQMGSKEEFFDFPERGFQKLIQEIIEVEAPIHWRALTRNMARCFGIQRLTRNAETVAREHIMNAHIEGRLFLKDHCAYLSSDHHFQLRKRDINSAWFRPDEIPMDECEMAIFMMLEQFWPLQQEDVFNGASLLLGYEKRDAVMDSQLEKATWRMASKGMIFKGNYGFQLKPGYYP